MALTKTRVWNNTEPGKVAQAVIMGIRGTDGESYVLEVDPAVATGIPVSDSAVKTVLDNIKLDTASVNAQVSAIGKGFFTLPYDELTANYAGATTDVWTSKLATVTQQTMTITYADATKAVITGVVVV